MSIILFVLHNQGGKLFVYLILAMNELRLQD